jgi:pyruvate,water dikinase
MMPQNELTFEAPGPGTWILDNQHNPTPIPRFRAEYFGSVITEAVSKSMAGWGDFTQVTRVGINGFSYGQVSYVGVEPGSSDAPLVDTPEVRERIDRKFAVYRDKLWRDKARRWYEVVKPDSIETNLALASIHVVDLNDESLIQHISVCRDNAIEMFHRHFEFNGTGSAPTGLLIELVTDTTDLSTEDALSLLDGASPISSGVTPELLAAAEAIRGDGPASALIASGDDPEKIVDRLQQMPGQVGITMSRYLLIDGHRLATGFDVTSKMALELPEVLLGVLQNAVNSEISDQSAESTVLSRFIRDKIPVERREEFDELLADAREGAPIKDERGLYQDGWATGILRKALLEAGSRLFAMQRVDSVEHLMEADWAEVQAIWAGQPSPTSEELANRREYRMTTTWRDAPPFLGPPPRPPAPIEGLPEEIIEWAESSQAVTRAMRGTPPSNDAPDLVGITANRGSYEGTARVVMGDYDFRTIDVGDVLVTSSQSEAFNAIANRVGAIVTDTGGPLSHLSIISRELGIPCIAGCKNATALIPDGARVHVDADAGKVTILD